MKSALLLAFAAVAYSESIGLTLIYKNKDCRGAPLSCSGSQYQSSSSSCSPRACTTLFLESPVYLRTVCAEPPPGQEVSKQASIFPASSYGKTLIIDRQYTKSSFYFISSSSPDTCVTVNVSSAKWTCSDSHATLHEYYCADCSCAPITLQLPDSHNAQDGGVSFVCAKNVGKCPVPGYTAIEPNGTVICLTTPPDQADTPEPDEKTFGTLLSIGVVGGSIVAVILYLILKKKKPSRTNDDDVEENLLPTPLPPSPISPNLKKRMKEVLG